MKYTQNVILNNDFSIVKNSFQDIKFLQYLIRWQPVKLISWDGIKNNDKAHLKIWFLGWKDFKVIHKFNEESDIILSFTDIGNHLPLGLSHWEHHHIIKKKNTKVVVTDDLKFEHQYYLIGLLLYVPLIFPIFIRKFFYKIYFKKINNHDKKD